MTGFITTEYDFLSFGSSLHFGATLYNGLQWQTHCLAIGQLWFDLTLYACLNSSPEISFQ